MHSGFQCSTVVLLYTKSLNSGERISVLWNETNAGEEMPLWLKIK